LDDTLGLTDTGANTLADARTGKNGRHRLAGLPRQSVFGRLACYEDANDAERLCGDPAIRWVVGDRAITGSVASASQMGRFETKWVSRPENRGVLADLAGQWIDKVHQRRQPKMIVLDTDSSESRPIASRKAAPTTEISAAPAITAVRVQPVRRCRAVGPEVGQRAQRRQLARDAGAGDCPLSRHREANLFPGRRDLRQPPRCTSSSNPSA